MARARSGEDSLLRKALSPSGACATPLELGSLADGSLAQPAAARLRDHVWKCARCQTELALLKQFEDAAPEPDEERAVKWISVRLERRFSEAPAGPSPVRIHDRAAPPRRSLFSALNVAGFALAASAFAVAAIVGLREGRAPELTAPSQGASTVLRSAGIATLAPAGELDAAPEALRWEPRTDAASYSVQVMEVDRIGLWSAETRETMIALPPGIRARIVPGKPLLWEVVAKDAAGRIVASSGNQQFRVRM
jgi:hypothetical protein